MSLLQSVPGLAWVLGFTIASEIGDIHHFTSPKQIVGYTGLCPRVYQSGNKDYRGPLRKNGPKYLRWALIEAATHAVRHEIYEGLGIRASQAGHRVAFTTAAEWVARLGDAHQQGRLHTELTRLEGSPSSSSSKWAISPSTVKRQPLLPVGLGAL